jgi:hypothetical protein
MRRKCLQPWTILGQDAAQAREERQRFEVAHVREELMQGVIP